MQTRIYSIEFLTPCFCAGSDQTKAELRPSSIRGQIRWWFRALGGCRSEEKSEFGGLSDKSPVSSKFSIRVSSRPSGGQANWHLKIPGQRMGPTSYLLGFFCGRTRRLQPDGALPPRSSATVSLIFRKPPGRRLDQAIRVFFTIGALGFRVTRAAGAICSREHSLNKASWEVLAAELRSAGFSVGLDQIDFGDDWIKLLERAEILLKNKLRGRPPEGLRITAGRNGSIPNALGSAAPRQGSALLLRPVRIEGTLKLALLEAPHPRVLGTEALQAHGNRGPVLKLASLGH